MKELGAFMHKFRSRVELSALVFLLEYVEIPADNSTPTLLRDSI